MKAFDHQSWMTKLCYLSDIFDKLNTVNVSLQGQNSTISPGAERKKGA